MPSPLELLIDVIVIQLLLLTARTTTSGLLLRLSRPPDGIEAEFRKFYFEGAQAYTPENMGALTKLVPASHILFGTDYNRFPISHSVKLFESLKLSSGVRRAIERDNAVALLPRWKA